MKKYWLSPLSVIDPLDAAMSGIPMGTEVDDFGDPLKGVMIDGKTNRGPWACMTERSWKTHGGTGGKFGLGLAQKYVKQPDGRWLKVA